MAPHHRVALSSFLEFARYNFQILSGVEIAVTDGADGIEKYRDRFCAVRSDANHQAILSVLLAPVDHLHLLVQKPCSQFHDVFHFKDLQGLWLSIQ